MFHFDMTTVADPTDAMHVTAPDDAASPCPSLAQRWSTDPLGRDEVGDEIMVTSSRRMLRVAIAAADAGWRFAKEGRTEDPVAWMLTPRTMFGGEPPIDACQELINFERSVVLHGIGAELDADPQALDLLRDVDDETEVNAGRGDPLPLVENLDAMDPMSVTLDRPVLLTCWIDDRGSPYRTVGLCGLVTDSPTEFIDFILSRFGPEALATAEFVVGYDGTDPLAGAVVSETLALALEHAAECPTSDLARGFRVAVGWRVAA